ncbi:hypothetical protein [Aneurinibacillus terranovensis]|nr:hypothetical protein [Aneurinibacillus terranovensis]
MEKKPNKNTNKKTIKLSYESDGKIGKKEHKMQQTESKMNLNFLIDTI